MADLVADDRSDGSVVGGVVCLHVEHRWPQDGSREDDLVHAGVVVGIDRLRRHEPLAPIDRLAELVHLPKMLQTGRSPHVAEQLVGPDLQL